MSLSIYMKGDYEDLNALKAAKKQSQFKAKQSQYAGLRPEIRGMKARNPKQEE